MTNLMRLMINDHLEGDNFPLMGMFHWLIVDCEVPLSRIVDIADRRFSIPANTVLSTLDTMWE